MQQQLLSHLQEQNPSLVKQELMDKLKTTFGRRTAEWIKNSDVRRRFHDLKPFFTIQYFEPEQILEHVNSARISVDQLTQSFALSQQVTLVNKLTNNRLQVRIKHHNKNVVKLSPNFVEQQKVELQNSEIVINNEFFITNYDLDALYDVAVICNYFQQDDRQSNKSKNVITIADQIKINFFSQYSRICVPPGEVAQISPQTIAQISLHNLLCLMSRQIRVERYEDDICLECVVIINNESEEQNVHFENQQEDVFLFLTEDIKLANVQFQLKNEFLEELNEQLETKFTACLQIVDDDDRLMILANEQELKYFFWHYAMAVKGVDPGFCFTDSELDTSGFQRGDLEVATTFKEDLYLGDKTQSTFEKVEKSDFEKKSQGEKENELEISTKISKFVQKMKQTPETKISQLLQQPISPKEPTDSKLLSMINWNRNKKKN